MDTRRLAFYMPSQTVNGRYVCRGCGDLYTGYHGCGRPRVEVRNRPPITVRKPIYVQSHIAASDKYGPEYDLELDQAGLYILVSGKPSFSIPRRCLRRVAETMLALADRMDEEESKNV